jgi:hypothetical protein
MKQPAGKPTHYLSLHCIALFCGGIGVRRGLQGIPRYNAILMALLQLAVMFNQLARIMVGQC